jgi:UDP-N-acetylmuramoylalanine--D-glutamate ligase
LAECGAKLLITDLKLKEQLSVSLERLKKFENIKFILGEHRLEDFSGRGEWKPDFVLKSAGVPLDSPFILEAKKNNIPVEMDASLFCKRI